jgi:hypothetical protein
LLFKVTSHLSYSLIIRHLLEWFYSPNIIFSSRYQYFSIFAKKSFYYMYYNHFAYPSMNWWTLIVILQLLWVMLLFCTFAFVCFKHFLYLLGAYLQVDFSHQSMGVTILLWTSMRSAFFMFHIWVITRKYLSSAWLYSLNIIISGSYLLFQMTGFY